MGDEKLFVLGLGNKTRYVRREDNEQPCLKFIDNTLHPEQLMIIAVVGRPDPEKGFDGKVWIDWCCAAPLAAGSALVCEPRCWHVGDQDGSARGRIVRVSCWILTK